LLRHRPAPHPSPSTTLFRSYPRTPFVAARGHAVSAPEGVRVPGATYEVWAESLIALLSRSRALRGPGRWQRPRGSAPGRRRERGDRKSTRLNSSHVSISYAV